jgi:hypothetical protein
MSTDEIQQSTSVVTGQKRKLTFWLIVAAILYVLSSGPALCVKVESDHPFDDWPGDNVPLICIDPPNPEVLYFQQWEGILNEIYRPLAILAARTAIGAPLQSYWNFCYQTGAELFRNDSKYQTHGGVI